MTDSEGVAIPAGRLLMSDSHEPLKTNAPQRAVVFLRRMLSGERFGTCPALYRELAKFDSTQAAAF